MMKRAAIALLGGFLLAAPCTAQPTETNAAPVTWGGEATLASAYLWRGEVDINRFTLQPELWVGVGDVAVSSWSALTASGLHEHDLSLTFERNVSHATVRGGWINYFLPYADDGRYDNEVFAGVEYAARVAPSLTIWRGVGSTNSLYMEAAAASQIPWRRLSIEPALAAGYGGVDGASAALTHLEARVAVAWHRPGYTVQPFVSRVVGVRARRENHTAFGLLARIGE